ncbi:MAG TPA: response regulator [Gaiellaceae bacterium]
MRLGFRPSDRPDPGPGLGRILLVEDEQVVRDLACEMLEQQGYEVVCAADPEEALDLAGREQIDALVTDVVMPKMSGRVLAARLRSLRPDLPIVYTSGYTEDLSLRNGLLEAGSLFLQKPFGSKDLGRAVRAVLATASTGA